jgi:hypothetical protein
MWGWVFCLEGNRRVVIGPLGAGGNKVVYTHVTMSQPAKEIVGITLVGLVMRTRAKSRVAEYHWITFSIVLIRGGRSPSPRLKSWDPIAFNPSVLRCEKFVSAWHMVTIALRLTRNIFLTRWRCNNYGHSRALALHLHTSACLNSTPTTTLEISIYNLWYLNVRSSEKTC